VSDEPVDDVADDEAVIGANVARYRLARGMSQSDLAEAIGVHQQTILKIEKGTRPLRYTEAVALARAMGTSVAAFRDSPESVVAEANVMRLNRDLAAVHMRMTDLATELATALVRAVDEVATDRARPPRNRAPKLLMERLVTHLRTADGWPETFRAELTVVVRRIIREEYEIELPDEEEGQTVTEMLQVLAGTPVEFNDAALGAMDAEA
jgi:DNA-binding XRE family transcriptional regulator